MKLIFNKYIYSFVFIVLLFAISLPSILHKAGLHPTFDGEVLNLSGKKALIIATNHGILNAPNKIEGKPTGLLLSELSVPYFDFIKSGIDVDIASIKGGLIPLEPIPYFIKTPEDKKFMKNSSLMSLLKNSISIDDIDFTEYDIIVISGGWGAAYDLGYSEVLGAKISEAYYQSKAIIGGICHGVLGLIKAKDTEGNLLIAGRLMTGVTDKQIQELGISLTPMHPEDELRKAGVIFKSNTAFKDFFANLTVVDDEQRFVTGQNQNAGHETAYKMMAIVANQ
jgi:putative intracellular protease/amidase